MVPVDLTAATEPAVVPSAPATTAAAPADAAVIQSASALTAAFAGLAVASSAPASTAASTDTPAKPALPSAIEGIIRDHGRIVRLKVDAIVNAANSGLFAEQFSIKRGRIWHLPAKLLANVK
ncbi:hypothetical protein BGZ70_008777 [Mortierella alpina]|uniref:Uncharacterized protein n=1 Tax=Mortierella alpina TaxID=64518 RepID=A0A9P6J2U6_MORAP|nr:hypothetical protein BGZ70_008777 [Mortierella alpina]